MSKVTKSTTATSVEEWKKDVSGPLELPSGKSMVVRRVSFRVLMKSGMIPNSLMGLVQQSLDKGKEIDINQLTEKMEGMDEMFEMMDNVICFCAVRPEVNPLPDSEEDRSDDLLYVDEVSDEDKMFIFQWVTGGTRDIERFREGFTSSLATLPNS